MNRVFAAALCLAASGSIAASTLVIDNARLPGPAASAPAGTVTLVIRDGRIAAIGNNPDRPVDAEHIDAGGRPVTPGLFNAATRLGLVEIDSARDTVDSRAGETGLGADFDVQYALNPTSTLLPLARADGLTRAMVFPERSAEPPFSGHGAIIRLGGGTGLLEQARAAWFVAIGGDADRSRAGDWQILRQRLADADNHPMLAPVLEGERPLAIVTHRASDIRQAVAVARDFDLRLVLVGATEAWQVASQLAEHAVDVVLDPAADLPMRFDQLGARSDNAAILHRAGVRVAFHVNGVHASHNAGLALREAAGVAVAHGLEERAALAAITVNPARIWAPDGPGNTLAPGARADLVIWDGDPLEPTSVPVTVLMDGRPVSLATRQKALRDRYHPEHRP